MIPPQEETRPGEGRAPESIGEDRHSHDSGDGNLARLARQRAKLARQMVDERAKVLLSDVEDQLSAEYSSREEIWAEIVERAQAEVVQADTRIAEICKSWGVPDEFRPELKLSWFRRGANAEAERRAELRKLAKARVEAAIQSAKVTIDHKRLEIETELVRDGLDSVEAHSWLDSMPSPDELLPRLDVDELESSEHQPWQAPQGLAGDLLTPSNGRSREERRQAVNRALTANPDASNRQIARMAGVDHKTVAAVRQDPGEIPNESGEIPAGGAE